MSQTRRAFLQTSALAAAAATLPRTILDASTPELQATYRTAVTTLQSNVQQLPERAADKDPGYGKPVLIEGSTYKGVWMECAPQEGLVWAKLGSPKDGTPSPLEVARNNHDAFFTLQRPDGQIPSAVKIDSTGFSQIQMVVPIAATAWEIAQLDHSQAFLERAYAACSRWDAWLRQYRDTRKTGLVEGFCTFDTGHDNSPRWAGIPNRCPDGDARKCPPIPSLPRLCPDLSATVYGARIALAAMARALGKPNEESRWLADAEHIRKLIITKLYSPEDAAFYDLDAQNNFVRVRSDVISRVLGEHVLDLSQPGDKRIFEDVWTRQLHNPKAFWAPYPLSSIAQNDPVLRPPHPAQLLGRSLAGPHRPPRPALDEPLRQGRRPPPHDAPVGRSHHPRPHRRAHPRRLPPADGPADRRLHPPRPRRLLPLRPRLPRLPPAPRPSRPIKIRLIA